MLCNNNDNSECGPIRHAADAEKRDAADAELSAVGARHKVKKEGAYTDERDNRYSMALAEVHVPVYDTWGRRIRTGYPRDA